MARFVEYRGYNKDGKCLSGLVVANGRCVGFYQGAYKWSIDSYKRMTNAQMAEELRAFGSYDYDSLKTNIAMWKRTFKGARITKTIYG